MIYSYNMFSSEQWDEWVPKSLNLQLMHVCDLTGCRASETTQQRRNTKGHSRHQRQGEDIYNMCRKNSLWIRIGHFGHYSIEKNRSMGYQAPS